MRIREFQHGTFTVLIVTPFDVSKWEINLPFEMAIKQERDTLAGTRRILQAHGGKLVDIFGPPVIAIWPSPDKTPDRRALDSALAIELKDRDGRSGAPLPESGRRELSLGICCGPLIFQEHDEIIINVLGPALTRAQFLHDLARKRGAALAIDSALAELAGPEIFQRVEDDAWWKA